MHLLVDRVSEKGRETPSAMVHLGKRHTDELLKPRPLGLAWMFLFDAEQRDGARVQVKTELPLALGAIGEMTLDYHGDLTYQGIRGTELPYPGGRVGR